MSFDLWEIFKSFLTSMLTEIVNSWLHELEAAFGDIIQTAFYIEKLPGLTANILSPETIRSAVSALYFTTVGLVTLKLLWKGWKVYILNRDGDAETSPSSMLVNSIYALGVAFAFPVLYDISTQIAIGACKSVLRIFPGVNTDNYINTIIALLTPWINSQVSLFLIILVLAFIVIFVILAIQMVFRGVEMFFYRLGVPFAVVGLVDSDGGVWKTYVQLYFQQLGTIMIQYCCICLGLRLAASITVPSMIAAIAFLIGAFSTPKLLRTVLSSGGGGGGSQVISVAVMAAKAFV